MNRPAAPPYWLKGLSFDIESLIGTGSENDGFSGISGKTSGMETAKEAVATKAIAIKGFPVVANTTKVITSANPNCDRNLIKSEFLCDSMQSQSGASTIFATRTVNPESKCSSTAFHSYSCMSGRKSQCAIPASSPSVSG
ncbi:unnamed protein product [Onchocerca ochengi]|uniref:DUF4150 domain-containing protein n=1 Tax=Onchocerca ochengi TaxID=42157 RepID=A0A182E7U1_ONCOC|nr:unnamed protein product [Onchocerca ochengi]